MDVKSTLQLCGVSDAHFELISEAIPEGYAALRKLADSTPMFAGFMPGFYSLGYLRNTAVQYALQTKAGFNDLFFVKTAFNAARNSPFIQLQTGNVIFTTHYCGKRGTRSIRKSISRAKLNQRNGDLFTKEADTPDAFPNIGAAYAQIVHGGLSDPVVAAIRIPNRDQVTSLLAPMILDLKKADPAKVEEVRDRIAETIKAKSKQDKGQERDAG
ncbi:MAG: hypothetical protein JSR34_02960 [Proteobacteria bacterium]|nr:hypothetical protein [Pseudomonadota bacterium]